MCSSAAYTTKNTNFLKHYNLFVACVHEEEVTSNQSHKHNMCDETYRY